MLPDLADQVSWINAHNFVSIRDRFLFLVSINNFLSKLKVTSEKGNKSSQDSPKLRHPADDKLVVNLTQGVFFF